MVDTAPAVLPCERQMSLKRLSSPKDRAAVSVKQGETTATARPYRVSEVSRQCPRPRRGHARER